MVSVPVRLVAVLLGAAASETVLLPVPPAPDWMVRKASLLDAVHLQEAVVVTVTESAPPAAPIDWAVELRLRVQAGPLVIVNVWVKSSAPLDFTRTVQMPGSVAGAAPAIRN